MKSVLTIAGSDPTGGAGLEQDLRCFQAAGVHGMALATALTTQDSGRVHKVVPTDPQDFALRLQCLLHEVKPTVLKLGMLATGDHARSVAAVLAEEMAGVPVVLDPVLRSTSGASLIDSEGAIILRDAILPQSAVVLPNRSEARLLVGADLPMAETAAQISQRGPLCLITDGDGSEPFLSEFVGDRGEVNEERVERVPGEVPHGTGCALAAFTAAFMAAGFSPLNATKKAGHKVRAAIRSSQYLGLNEAPFRPLLVFGNDDE